VNDGSDVTCVCKGEGGNPPADVKWYSKDGNQIGGTTKEEQTLTLSNVGKTDSGTYTCVAQSHDLAKNETSIKIIVNCKHKLVKTLYRELKCQNRLTIPCILFFRRV
jgi:hypothetical protein